MSYQYYDQNDHQGGGIPGYPEPLRQQRNMRPPQGRRPPPPQGYAGQYQQQPQQRGPPPMRPQNQDMRPPPPRQPQQSPRQQQYVPQPERESTSNLYDGSAYGEPEYEMSDHWPLPAQQAARQQVPQQSPRQTGARGPPPQRPQRPDSLPQELQGLPQGQVPRVAPANKRYPPGFPPDQAPQQQQASHHGTGQWNGDGYNSPTTGLPSPNHMRPVTGSSTYSSDSAGSYPSIPDFPVPQLPQQAAVYGRANQRPPLGPPPSARRGPPSYYGQAAAAEVHPITEEEENHRNSQSVSHLAHLNAGNHDSLGGKSYASSNAIPIGIPDYYLQSERGSVPSLPDRSDGGYPESPIEPVPPLPTQHMPGEQIAQPPPPPPMREEASPEPGGLVRQASLGKMRKPSLTTVKGGERSRKNSTSTDADIPRKDSETVGAGLASLPSQQRYLQRPQPAYQEEVQDFDGIREPERMDTAAGAAREQPLYSEDKALEAGYAPSITSSLADSEHDGRSLKKKSSKDLLGASLAKESAWERTRSRSRSPVSTLSAQDKQIEEILTSLGKGGALTSDEVAKLQAHPAFSNKETKHRPPRLNLDSVREAEARGSLTSLPDLIRRATKLASNLDRGRTASRLGMAAWLDGGTAEENEKNRARYEAALAANRRSGSISDMLGQFPPPGLATPEAGRSRTDLRGSLFGGSGLRNSRRLGSDSDAGEARRARRQAGNKDGRKRCCGMPLWLFLLVLVLLILLVAAAIILPVVLVVIPNQQDDSPATTSSGASCSPELSCANGGLNVAAEDGSCRCLCVSGYTGRTCTQPSSEACTSIDISGSTDDATVGSDIPALLENAEADYGIPLDSERILGLFSAADLSCASENALVSFSGLSRRSEPQATRVRQRRQAATSTNPAANAATSAGIVYDSSEAPDSSSSSSASSASSTSSTSGSSSSSSSSGSATSSQTVDFARAAVLYVFQTSGQLNTAATAQERLQNYFTDGTNKAGQSISGSAVGLGNGYVADLEAMSLRIGNGTVVGS